MIPAPNAEAIAWIYLDEMLMRDRAHHTRDSIFGNEVRPKPTSPGHAYGHSSPKTTKLTAQGAGQSRQHAPQACHHVLLLTLVLEWVTSAAPSSFYRGAGLQEPTNLAHLTLYC